MKEKIITNKLFPYFLGITALLIALCAAFFSVYGIGNLFLGASVSAMIMAGSLEIGKLVATTFLYRYWTKTIGLVKTYLTIAVISLMIITSAGIFGFLSAAYQKSSLTFKLTQDRILSIEQSKGFYSNQISSASERINILNETRKIQESRLSEALTNTFLVRNPIQLQQLQQQTIKMIDQANEDIKNENDKIEKARSTIQNIDEKVNEMKIGATEKKDIQTFKFLADALNVSLDTVAKWFILSLIFVFDPLAIALILAYNVVVYKKEDERIYDKPEPDVNNSFVESSSKKTELIQNNDPVIIPEIVETEVTSSNLIRHTNEDTLQTEVLKLKETEKEQQIVGQMTDYYKRLFKK